MPMVMMKRRQLLKQAVAVRQRAFCGRGAGADGLWGPAWVRVDPAAWVRRLGACIAGGAAAPALDCAGRLCSRASALVPNF